MFLHPAAVGLFGMVHAAFETRDDLLHGCLDRWLDDLDASELRDVVETLLLMLEHAATAAPDLEIERWLRHVGAGAAGVER